jgi:hypothetical protein
MANIADTRFLAVNVFQSRERFLQRRHNCAFGWCFVSEQVQQKLKPIVQGQSANQEGRRVKLFP